MNDWSHLAWTGVSGHTFTSCLLTSASSHSGHAGGFYGLFRSGYCVVSSALVTCPSSSSLRLSLHIVWPSQGLFLAFRDIVALPPFSGCLML